MAYRTSNLPRATVVSGELSGLSSRSTPGLIELAVLSLAVVLLVLGGGAVLVARRTRATASRSRDAPADLAQERVDLVVRIATLDERFAAGEVSDVDYRHSARSPSNGYVSSHPGSFILDEH